MSDIDDIGLFDMDGSLADYEGALKRDMEIIRYPYEPVTTDFWDDSKSYKKARMHLIKSQPGWWSSLPPIKEGFDVLKLALYLGFDCQVLTKGPKKHPTAWKEKVEWCQAHFANQVNMHEVNVHIVSDKKIIYGKFLYDDYPDYMLRWLKHRPRGLGIMPVTEYNKDFKHPNVLMWDGTNLSKVEEVLRFVKERSPGEPLCPL